MNIVFIITDTFRRDHVGCYGAKWMRTPHLDRFAARALRFTKYYPASFPTVPNRHDLVTGRFTFPYAMWSPLPPDAVTLAERLGEAGYVSMMIADTPHALAAGMNYQRGFTAWDLIRGQEGDRWWTDEAEIELPCDPKKLRTGERVIRQHLQNALSWRGEEDTFVAQTMRRASHWLERNAGREKFFLWVDTFDPHEPWIAPPPYVNLYDPDYEGNRVIYPVYGRDDYLTPREVRHMRAAYAAEATLTDRWIGHLLATIETLDLFRNTAVFVMSDHGFLLAEHGYTGKFDLPGQGVVKALPLYEALVATPLIVSIPGGQFGRTTAALCSTPDLTATALDLAGLPIPTTVQGRSLAPVLRGKARRHRPFAVASTTFPVGERDDPDRIGTSMLTDGRHTWLYGGTDQASALYDLKADPLQKRNLVRQERDRARTMHRRFVRFLEEVHCPEERLAPRCDPRVS